MKLDSNNNEGRILYLDDKENNLLSFKASFRREYRIFISSSPHEAFDLIEKNQIQIVVADFKMPEISGVTFLEEVKKRFPETIRIMLTGHADLPAVVESINRSEIFRFLAKPWKEEELRTAFNAGLNLYHTRKELHSKNEELKKAYVELDRLVYSTAHDITSPLSNILGLVSLIRMDGLKDGEYLDLIETTTKKLQFLARDVLNFHRNKRTVVEPKKLDLKLLVEKTLKDFEHFENASNVTFSLSINQKGEFYSDKIRWRIILSNLISNAIKYQDETKANRNVSILLNSDDEKAELIIQDNGVGIPQSLQPRIFDLYYRSSKMSTGSGIGLYIVSEAVSLLGGNIRVESVEKEGASFYHSIPNKHLGNGDSAKLPID